MIFKRFLMSHRFLIVIISTLLFVSCSDDLKFVCTDVSYTGTELSAKEIQKEKDKGLGSKISLHFYDNSVKLSAENDESLVLDKRSRDDIYEYSETKRGKTYRVVLTPEKWFGYIKAFTLSIYMNGSLEGTITYKRDEWTKSIVDIID